MVHPRQGYSDNYSYRSDKAGSTWILFIVSMIILLATLLWTGIYDGAGKQESDHRQALPSAFEAISAHSYLVPAGTNPNAVCGPEAGSTAIDNLKVVKDQWMIKCTFAQSWNSKAPTSLGFTEAAGRIMTSPAYIGLWSFVIFAYLGFWFARWRIAVRKVKPTEEKNADLEDERTELLMNFSATGMTTAEYSDALEKLYQAGLKRPRLPLRKRVTTW
jgi:hypothetical protein